jgi:hypothetical protein
MIPLPYEKPITGGEIYNKKFSDFLKENFTVTFLEVNFLRKEAKKPLQVLLYA